MLEGLHLTCEAKSDRNRAAVARSTVADVLWSLVLPWSGEYSDASGRVVLEMMDPERGAVLIKREVLTEDGSRELTESVGVIFQGTAIEVVLDPSEGRVIGSHMGHEIRFADSHGTVWTRKAGSFSPSSSSSSSGGSGDRESAAREVLRLVLTQVLLSLRWEPTFLGLGIGKVKAGDLVAIDAARRPLLSFLL